MTTTAQIAGKGCSGTGITEELAERFHDQLGKKVMAIVEIMSEARTEDRKGDQKVKLSIISIEPVTGGFANETTEAQADETVRGIQRALYQNRMRSEKGPQLPLGDGPEPSVRDVLAASQGLFTVDDTFEDDVDGPDDEDEPHTDDTPDTDPDKDAA